MARGDYNQRWAVAGESLPPEPLSPRLTRFRNWLEAKCQGANVEGVAREVVCRHVVERHGFGAIRNAMQLEKGQAEAAYREAMAVLESVPGFWDKAREFSRQVVPCAEGRADFDERPDEVRGVTPDRSSQRFQGSSIVPRDDLRVRQNATSAARMWVISGA